MELNSELYASPSEQKKRFTLEIKTMMMMLALCAVGVIISIVVLVLPPTDFPVNQIMTVKNGQTLKSISAELSQLGYIKSASLFRAFVSLSGNAQRIKSGSYQFTESASLFTVAKNLSQGIYGDVYVTVTIPEGNSVAELSQLIQRYFPHLLIDDFQKLANPYEGKLFPDTYRFEKTTSAKDIIDTMLQNYDTKTKLVFEMLPDEKTRQRILIIASLLEDEAVHSADARVIAGILQNRIAQNMPLQIDATLRYYTGRGSKSLLMSDLRTDNPYNTYTNPGLPPGPINSPGLERMIDAMNPTSSQYLFYLHGPGKIPYYATTFEQHVRNKRKYL